jgi:hypothetical protein
VRRFGDALRAADGRHAEKIAYGALMAGLSVAEVLADHHAAIGLFVELRVRRQSVHRSFGT